MVQERVGILENEVRNLKSDLAEIKSDVREMRDAMVGAKWAGRALLGVIAILGGMTGWLMRG